MKIKEMLSHSRRDFRAIFVCEACSHEMTERGYDDYHFHYNVVPNWYCEKCGEKSPVNYKAQETKYDDYEVI